MQLCGQHLAHVPHPVQASMMRMEGSPSSVTVANDTPLKVRRSSRQQAASIASLSGTGMLSLPYMPRSYAIGVPSNAMLPRRKDAGASCLHFLKSYSPKKNPTVMSR